MKKGKQLKTLEIKAYREELLKKQDFVCPLCGEEILLHEATLDHDHGTGHIRQVLHRSCNQGEGRILSWAGKRTRGTDPEEFLRNLLKYWKKSYKRNPLHPQHGKPIKRRKRKPRKRK